MFPSLSSYTQLFRKKLTLLLFIKSALVSPLTSPIANPSYYTHCTTRRPKGLAIHSAPCAKGEILAARWRVVTQMRCCDCRHVDPDQQVWLIVSIRVSNMLLSTSSDILDTGDFHAAIPRQH